MLEHQKRGTVNEPDDNIEAVPIRATAAPAAEFIMEEEYEGLSEYA